MTSPQSPVLEFPAMLHGHTGEILRKVSAMGKRWAREYLKTGGFTQPRHMLRVPPGEVLLMHAAAELEFMDRASWRVHLFREVSMNLDLGVPKEERPRMEEAFESFCLSIPWGALYRAVSPPPMRSAQRMARRLSALLSFWDVLQGPRYAFGVTAPPQPLDGLMKHIYGMTLEAWCPGGPTSVRERMTLMVERMARATREECSEAVLQVLPVLVRADASLQHREVLSDPGFLRERLAALPPKNFESISSADRYAVNRQLYDWDRALGRQ